jgi:hypothetical protein
MYSYTHNLPTNKQVTSKLQALEANKQASKQARTLTLASKQAGTSLLAC